jgi:hypothetical protein
MSRSDGIAAMSVITQFGLSGALQRLRDNGWRWNLRVALIVVTHVAAACVLASVEYGPFANTVALLTWALLNFLFLIVLRRPGVSALLSLALIVTLITLSQFKYGITQLTLTFLDFLIVDRDTLSFLHSIFPQLKTQLVIFAVIAVPVMWVIWRSDPFRIRRAVSTAGAVACVAAITGLSVIYPEQPWEPFQGVNHISNLARSGVVSVSHLTSTGWIEADPPNLIGSAQATPLAECEPGKKRPNIIMVLDESSFDISAAPGIKVPANYRDYFKSADGKQRSFVAESAGGPTWYTEFNVLTGLSARSFGKLKFYVTRIAAGKISRGLPQSLQRCGYVSDLWRLPQCAQLPDVRGYREICRYGGHGRQRGYAARPVLLRSGAAIDRAREECRAADVRDGVSHRQSFSLDDELSPGPDARGLDRAGQRAGSR